MPSVRVKRGQYASYANIDELSAEGTQGRPRSQSTLQSPGSPASFEVPQPPNVRNRSQTVSGVGGYAGQRRPTSKISDHIMSTSRVPRIESASFNPDHRVLAGQPLSSPQAGQSGVRRSTDHSVISLRGSTENVVYHGDAHQLGRIGSALSHTTEGDENDHHHDDIVEHLEVIGTLSVLIQYMSSP
jgi:hypothetical protein